MLVAVFVWRPTWERTVAELLWRIGEASTRLTAPLGARVHPGAISKALAIASGPRCSSGSGSASSGGSGWRDSMSTRSSTGGSVGGVVSNIPHSEADRAR